MQRDPLAVQPHSSSERYVASALSGSSLESLQKALQEFDPPLRADEHRLLLAAIPLASISTAPLFFTSGESHLALCTAPNQLAEIFRHFEFQPSGSIEVSTIELHQRQPLWIVRLASSYPKEAHSTTSAHFQEARELFLQGHPLQPDDPAWLALTQAITPDLLETLTVTQQADLLDLAYSVQGSDALQLRITESPSGGLLIYGAGGQIPSGTFPLILLQAMQRAGWEWHRYRQGPPKQSEEGVGLFCASFRGALQPIQGLNREEALAALARELRLSSVFSRQDRIEQVFVLSQRIRADLAAPLRAMVRFCHQGLLYLDPFEFNLANCEDTFCAHPEIAEILLQAFEHRFHPMNFDDGAYRERIQEVTQMVEQLQTGHEPTDARRRIILQQAISFLQHILKTTFYAASPSLAFRLDPAYLDRLPSAAREKFPELPFGIFLLFQNQSLGYHIRFRDLARGGLRTVVPHHFEQLVIERNQIFQEGYHLAFTQQKKNKDIPEGGAKGILLLNPFEALQQMSAVFEQLPEIQQLSSDQRAVRLQALLAETKTQQLYRAQRQYIEGLILLVNSDENGRLRDARIRDLYGRPEYLYVGPDENMHNSMLLWIASFAQRVGYRPGAAFISSKPGAGINHKEYGVTSLGVHVYVEEILRYLGIHPEKDPFTVKMSGGPDGDVAGNEMVNLLRRCAQGCRLLCTIDGSGTILDPQGLNLEALDRLFFQAEPVRHYPMELLSEGSYFVDSRQQKSQPHGPPLMLCQRKLQGGVQEQWIPQSEAFALLRTTLFQTPADLFIPAGGRPRTLHESNIEEFCLPGGEPSVRAIVEGANLFLTPKARRYLEEKGVLIIKDSSANKGGVICSSFEVLLGLTLSEQEFLQLKPTLMPEILELIREKALAEAQLLVRTHEQTGRFLTDLSDEVSARINLYKDQLLQTFTEQPPDLSPGSPMARVLLSYCPPLIREQYADRVLSRLPPTHQHAILACQIAAQTVYRKGLEWSPSIVEVLPLLLDEWSA